MDRRKTGRRKEDRDNLALQQELKAFEERYRHLFEEVRHGLVITTREGGVVDCNRAMFEMLGYESKEAFLSIDIEKDLYVNLEDRRRFQHEIEEKGYVKDYEVNFKKKNGKKITVLLTCNARLDSKGGVIGYQGLNIDITERNRMEKELRAATRQFQKISEMVDFKILFSV